MLLKLIVLLAISCAPVLGAAVPPGMQERIVGGEQTRISEFPWLVSLQRHKSHACAGSIYNHNIVLTAAHCVQSAAIAALRVRAGSSYWNSGGVLIPVAAYKIHEGYNPKTMLNDLAVVRLESTLSFNADIWYISIAVRPPMTGTPAMVAGWGATSYGSATMPNSLQSVEVEVVRTEDCASSSYGYGSEVQPSMICAAADGKGVCTGDSGSSLVSDGLLVGIYSWTYGCAFANYPGVYTDVTEFRSWIANAVGGI